MNWSAQELTERVFNRAHQTPHPPRQRGSIAPAMAALLDRVRCGTTLLVGEENLSFSRSIGTMPLIDASRIVATTFEATDDWSREAIENFWVLRLMKVAVHDDIDATKLERHFPTEVFDTIIFQFPNAGSRKAVRGHNPNFVLVRRFLMSAAQRLKPNGRVMITAVDSPYYEGAFHFAQAASDAGLDVAGPIPFDPFEIPGYHHTNTNDDESAILEHEKFGAWIFAPAAQGRVS